MTDTRSTQRVALVTGSARGIGRAIVEALVADGIAVIGVDILDQEATGLLRTIRADLSQPSECDRILAESGKVDILVNNAAVLIEQDIEEVTVADFDRILAVNLRAVFLLSQGVIVGMRESGWGRIINIASIGARTGGFYKSSVYSAAKAGVVSLTKNFARTQGRYGVTSNAVAPGGIDTEMAVKEPTVRQSFISQIPLGRFAEPREVAAVVAFVAGEGSSWINGATIDVNGGMVIV